MGLRLKTALTITGIFVSVMVATYLLFSVSLLNEFKQLERARTAKNLDRIFQAFNAIKTDLGNRVADWGHWDDTLTFIQGRDPQYVPSNLNYEALVPFELKNILFISSKNELAYGAEISSELGSSRPLPASLHRSLTSNPAIQDFMEHPHNGALSGMLLVDGVPSFVSIATISDSKAQHPAAGFVLFTRELTPKLQEEIGRQTQLPVRFDSPPALVPPSDTTLGGLSISEDGDSITGTGLLRDLSGTPIAQATFTQPREILHEGLKTRDSLMLVMGLFLVLANGIVLLFLDRTVLRPLARFSRRIATISKTNDLSLKVSVDRRDEIGKVSEVFNSLIDSLRASYERVQDARNAAEEANEAKSKFIATVSHELRTPIHSITGMLRILRQNETAELKRGYIDMANESAFGLLETINEILDFSKVESGGLAFEHREFDPRTTIQKAARSVSPRRTSSSKAVELIVDISPRVPRMVHGDPHRLGQVLVNLLGNACKFTHEGYVSLCVDSSDARQGESAQLTFVVEDSGIGIPADQQENIFKAFNQGASSTPRLYEGSGLGLSIVKQVVERMGGSISLVSEEHHGSAFTVSIPMRCEQPAPPVAEQRAVALVAYDGLSRRKLVEACTRHASLVEVFDSGSSADLSALNASLQRFDHVVLWGPSEADTPILAPVLQAASEQNLPVSAVINPEQLALRTELSYRGVSAFPAKSSGVGEILTVARGSEAPAADNTSPCLDPDTHAHEPLRVLIADDTPTNCIILQSMLEEAGHSVEVVTNGLDLLNRLKPIAAGEAGAANIDLVMTDIQMPLMDGNTAVQKLRLLEECAGREERLPVVAVTAHALPEEQLSMRRAGMDHIVTKPINPADLGKVLRSCTGRTQKSHDRAEPTPPLEHSLRVVAEEVCGNGTALGETVDLLDVFERSGKSLRRTRMVFEAFLSAYDAPKEVINEHLSSGDILGLSRAVHMLKGLLLDVGARDVAVYAGKLEQRCKDGFSFPGIEAEVGTLVSAAGKAAGVIKAMLEKLPRAQ